MANHVGRTTHSRLDDLVADRRAKTSVSGGEVEAVVIAAQGICTFRRAWRQRPLAEGPIARQIWRIWWQLGFDMAL